MSSVVSEMPAKSSFSAEPPFKIPDTWNWVTLGDIFGFEGGGTPSKNISEYWNGGVPWASVKDIKGKYLESTVDQISEEGLRSSAATMAMPGDILLVTRITPGKCTISRIETAVNQDLKIIRPKIVVNSVYVWMFFSAFQEQLAALGSGTTVKGLRLEHLNSFPFPLPPIDEQKRIVERIESLLGKINAAQEVLREISASNELLRKSILYSASVGRLTSEWRSIFGRPEHVNKILKLHSEATLNRIRNKGRMKPNPSVSTIDYSNELPDTWGWYKIRELIALGVVLDIQDGNHGELYPRKTDFSQEGIPYLSAEHVANDIVQLDDAPKLSFAKARQLRVGFSKSRDVILTHNATVGRVGVVPNGYDEVLLSTSTTYYRVDEAVLDPFYLAIVLRSPLFQNQLINIMSQTTRNQVSIMKQTELSIPMPPLEEQKEIVRLVEISLKQLGCVSEYCVESRAHMEGVKASVFFRAFRGML